MRLVAKKWDGVAIDEPTIRRLAVETLANAYQSQKDGEGDIAWMMTGDTLILATVYDNYPEIHICKVDRHVRKPYDGEKDSIEINWEPKDA